MFSPLDVKLKVESLQQEILYHLENVVDINSNSSNTIGLRDMAVAIETIAASYNISFRRVPVAGERKEPFHLLYDGTAGSSEKFYGIIGHFDTVHMPDSKFVFGKRDDGKLYGPGLLDMKGGIIAALYSAIIVQEFSGKNLPLKIIFNCDEEVGSPDSRALIERTMDGAAGVFVFEPTRSHHRGPVVARKGILMGSMQVSGIPAHAGDNPEEGADAIVEAAGKILALHQLNNSETGTVVTVGKIKGGDAANQIPDHCACDLDVRISSTAEQDKVLQAIQEIMTATTVSGTQTTYNIASVRPPFEADSKSQELFGEYRKAATEFGLDTTSFTSGGGSDGNLTAARGIATLDGLGPGGHGAHTNDEYIYEQSLWDAICVFTLFFGRLIKKKKEISHEENTVWHNSFLFYASHFRRLNLEFWFIFGSKLP